MALWDYYLKEFPWNEWKLYRERIIDWVKYTHYRTWKSRDFRKDHRVSYLNKEDAKSNLIVQRYKEWIGTSPE